MKSAVQYKRENLPPLKPRFSTGFASNANNKSAQRFAVLNSSAVARKTASSALMRVRFTQTRNEIIGKFEARHLPVARVSASSLQKARNESVHKKLTGKFSAPLGLVLAALIAGLVAAAGHFLGPLIIGMAAGAALGVPYALATDSRRRSRSFKTWIRWPLQCTVFGAVGGVVGVMLSVVIMSHAFQNPAARAVSPILTADAGVHESCVGSGCRLPAVEQIDLSLIPPIDATVLMGSKVSETNY